MSVLDVVGLRGGGKGKGWRLTSKLLLLAALLNWTLTLYYWSWLSRMKKARSGVLVPSQLLKDGANATAQIVDMKGRQPLTNRFQAQSESIVAPSKDESMLALSEEDAAQPIMDVSVHTDALNIAHALEANSNHIVPSQVVPTQVVPRQVVPNLVLPTNSLKTLKWYVYDVPQAFLPSVAEAVKAEYSPMSAELHLLGQIKQRSVKYPHEADLFYVPVLVSAFLAGHASEQFLEWQASSVVRSKAIRMVDRAITWVQNEFPFWNRTGGADHVFVFSHDNGPCLDISAERAQENQEVKALLQRLSNSLIISHTGDLRSGCFDPARSVVLPPPVPNLDVVRSLLDRHGASQRKRGVFLYYRDRTSIHSSKDSWKGIRLLYGGNGTAESHGQHPNLEPCLDARKLKSASHCERAKDKCKDAETFRRRVYSRGVRQNLNIFFFEFAQICTNCSNRVIRYSSEEVDEERDARDAKARITEMSDSTFCLSIRGWADWNVRTMEAMVAGCIPVIISDDAELPFSNEIDWNSVSIRIPEARAVTIYHRLDRVTDAEVSQMRVNIKAVVLKLMYPHVNPSGMVIDLLNKQLISVIERRRVAAAGVALQAAPKAKQYPKAIAAEAGVKEDEICLAVQMSPDRLHMLTQIAKRWPGQVFAVVIVRKSASEFNAEREWSTFFRAFPEGIQNRIHLQFYRAPKEWKYYPVNKLRNMALRGCAERAQFAMTMDVDFIPSTDAYTQMQAHVARLLAAEAEVGRRALVVPAFETTDEFVEDKHKLDRMLGSKLVIADMYLSDSKYRQRQTKRSESALWPFDQKRSSSGHRATNSEYWMKAQTPYRVEYKWGWEPYLLLRAPFPEYDESFVEYGQNKVLYAYELLAAGFEFVVLPDTYLIHAHVDPNKKDEASKPKQYQVGWSCWADFIVRVQQTYDGFRLPTPCWAAKYVYPEVMHMYQDRCITNPSTGSLTRLI